MPKSALRTSDSAKAVIDSSDAFAVEGISPKASLTDFITALYSSAAFLPLS